MDVFSFIWKKKDERKIKKIGFSFHDTADLLDEIFSAAEVPKKVEKVFKLGFCNFTCRIQV